MLVCVVMYELELLFFDELISVVDFELCCEFWEVLFELIDVGIMLLVFIYLMDEVECCYWLVIFDCGWLVVDGMLGVLIRVLEGCIFLVELDDFWCV